MMKRVLLLLALFSILSSCTPKPEPTLIGGDVDEHGCIPTAGYQWCESLQECVREWEKSCPDDWLATHEAKPTNDPTAGVATHEARLTEEAAKIPTPSATLEPTATPVPIRHTAIILGEDVMGTGTGARTDVFIIVSYIPHWNDLLIISIPRDLYVDYTGAQTEIFCNPPSEFDRINRAYALGGVDCVRAVVEHNFGLVANSGIAATGFQDFVEIINEMGGLMITPTKSRTYWCGSISGGDSYWSTKLEGETYLMHGEALLCYVRERMQYGGVERDRRAQEVLLAIKDYWLVAQPLDTIVKMLPFLLERVSVDLPIADIVGLIEIARAAFAEDVNIRKVTLLYDQEVTPHTTELGAWVFKPLVDLEGWMDCLLSGHSAEVCAWSERLDADD